MGTLVKIRQDKQIRSSGAYADTEPSGSGLESATTLQDDLNAMRSQINRIIDKTETGKWYDEPPADLVDIQYIAAATIGRLHWQPVSGAVNGVNTVFTPGEAFRHDGVSDESFYYNGMRLREGAGNDYVVSESVPGGGYDTITMVFAPRSGDDLSIDYTRVS